MPRKARPRASRNIAVPRNRNAGLIRRNYRKHPVGYLSFAPPFPDSELIPEEEWGDRLEDLRRTKSGLLDLRNDNYDALKSLDQNGYGLCWAFSTTKAVMYLRAAMNQPALRLSAWYVAGILNGWSDGGGFGAESLEFIVEQGVPEESYCPSYNSRYDTPETRANAALHKVTEWWDGSNNPTLARKQLVSMLLKRVPCVVDLNAIRHSMCAIDIHSLSPLEVIYDNSWGEREDRGLYYGKGATASPNGLVIPRVTMAT